MNSFEIVRLQCPSCGGSLDYESAGEVKCKHCGTISFIIPPAKSNLNTLDINEDWKFRLKNILFSIEQSISAGNFIEAKDFCNKGLEIGSSLGSIWENKAICAYWLTNTENIINTSAQEIFSYLSTARNVEPDSATFKSTVEKIFSNLFNRILYYKKIYIEGDYNKIIEIMNFMELCYDKYPDINFKFINYIIYEYTDNNSMIWLEQWPKGTIKTVKKIYDSNISFNPAEKYIQLINKVKQKYSNYNPPKIKLQRNYYWKIALFIISLFVIIILIYFPTVRTVCEWTIGILVVCWILSFFQN